jgi:S1-C subfamily serine protease
LQQGQGAIAAQALLHQKINGGGIQGPTAPRRSPGLSFSKTPAYWRVAGVVPSSAATAAAVERGDLITRINGEPVARWAFRRYARLVAEAREITFTFLTGTRETEKRIPVFELVP